MNETTPGHRLSHEKRVALYIHIITTSKLKINTAHMETMRHEAPGPQELAALNEAFQKLGYEG